MLDLFVYSMACFGLSNILCCLLVAEKLRKTAPDSVEKMLKCPACSGFWIGIVAGFFTPDYNPFELGLYTSASNWLLYGVAISLGLYDE